MVSLKLYDYLSAPLGGGGNSNPVSGAVGAVFASLPLRWSQGIISLYENFEIAFGIARSVVLAAT